MSFRPITLELRQTTNSFISYKHPLLTPRMDLFSMLNGSMPSKKRDYSMSNPNYHSQAMPQPKRLQQTNESNAAATTPPPAPLPSSSNPKPTATATAAAVVEHPHSKEKSVSDTKKGVF